MTAVHRPLQTLALWLDEARATEAPEPEAMALATVGPDGRPSVRIVLCRGIGADGLSFFTNYDSRKGRELAGCAHAAAAFHWPLLRRQVRVEGDVTMLSAADSDAYFRSRPRGSQLSAAVSPQSAPIESLERLREDKRRLEASLDGAAVPRPPHWGGYLLQATRVELWTNGEDRLHERLLFERAGLGSPWVLKRLAP
jgi:pyridoxamine 5'-phosphate oxidase